MNSSLQIRGALIGILAFSCYVVPRQDLRAQDDDGQQALDSLVSAARALMQAAEYCALITLDSSGRPQVRTMDPFAPDDDMIVWLGTHRRSRKVEQIGNDPRVALYYEAPGGAGYVAVSGTARLVDDPSEKARRWKEEWKQFYVAAESDYILIEVRPDVLEIVDYSRGIVGDPETWRVPSVRFVPGGAGG